MKLLCATDEDAEDVMIHFSQGSSLIQTLKLYNSSLTDKGLYSLLDHLSSVEHLELVSCNEITEDGIIKALPINLSSIVILDCIHVADVVFSAVAKLPRLQSFTIQVSQKSQYKINMIGLPSLHSHHHHVSPHVHYHNTATQGILSLLFLLVLAYLTLQFVCSAAEGQ